MNYFCLPNKVAKQSMVIQSLILFIILPLICTGCDVLSMERVVNKTDPLEPPKTVAEFKSELETNTDAMIQQLKDQGIPDQEIMIRVTTYIDDTLGKYETEYTNKALEYHQKAKDITGIIPIPYADQALLLSLLGITAYGKGRKGLIRERLLDRTQAQVGHGVATATSPPDNQPPMSNTT